MALLTLPFISANKITSTSFSSLYPSCQTALSLAWGSRGDRGIESDKDWGVRSPAVTAPLLVVQASPLSLSYLSQAVIQNPFSNGGSPAGEAVGGETRFAYFPATAVSDGTVSVQAATDPTLTQAGGESLLTLNLGWVTNRSVMREQQSFFSVVVNEPWSLQPWCDRKWDHTKYCRF